MSLDKEYFFLLFSYLGEKEVKKEVDNFHKDINIQWNDNHRKLKVDLPNNFFTLSVSPQCAVTKRTGHIFKNISLNFSFFLSFVHFYFILFFMRKQFSSWFVRISKIARFFLLRCFTLTAVKWTRSLTCYDIIVFHKVTCLCVYVDEEPMFSVL